MIIIMIIIIIVCFLLYFIRAIMIVTIRNLFLYLSLNT